MFKKSKKLAGLMKRQVALVLSIIMALSCFATAGLSFSSVFAEELINDGGLMLADTSISLIKDGNLNYVEGSSETPNVDSNGFLKAALMETYGTTMAYVCDIDEEGNYEPILFALEKQWIDLTKANAYNTELEEFIGKYLCIEGNGIKTYYCIITTDMETGDDLVKAGQNYNSALAHAAKAPGSIMFYKGKYMVSLGHCDSVEELKGDWDVTDAIVDWNEFAYNMGETYIEDDSRYWFGKTWFAYAQDETNGFKISNIHSPGDIRPGYEQGGMVILRTEALPSTVDVVVEQYDDQGQVIDSGVTYEIHRKSDCSDEPLKTINVVDGKATFNYEIGTYYLKQTAVPDGYVKTDEIIRVELTGKNVLVVKLYLVAQTNSVGVQILDRYDPAKILKDARVALQEWDESAGEYKTITELGYNPYSQRWVIDKEYTNNDGTIIKDRQLHETVNNLGKFQVVQIGAHDGYQYVNDGKPFVLADMVGDDTTPIPFYNIASFVVDVYCYYPDAATPLAGQNFAIKYPNDATQYNCTAATDISGYTTIEGLAPGSIFEKDPADVDAGYPKLYQSHVDVEGYVQNDMYINGYEFTFEKDPDYTRDGCFVTRINVSVREDENYVAFQHGVIDIQKIDNTNVTDPGNVGIQGAIYGVYTDIECTEFAQDISGATLNNLTTDASGKASANVGVGTYYIKEIGTTDGYATNNEVKTITFGKDEANHDNNGIITKDTIKFDTLKQSVTLSVVKKDADSKKVLEGAVFGLYSTDKIVTSTLGQVIEPNTLLGLYKTDINGKIFATEIGTDAFDDYEAVAPIDEDGNPVNDKCPLPNAHYYFVEIDPNGQYVKTDNRVEFDASYVKNETLDGVDTDDYSVSGKGITLVMAPKEFLGTRQAGTINFTLVDSEKSKTIEHYGISDGTYDVLVDANMVASLKGAQIHLYTTTDVLDIETGTIIPANTCVGVYDVVNGSVLIEKFNIGDYANHKIPNGSYKVVLDAASFGYIADNTEAAFDLNYDETKDSVSASVQMSQTIVKQNVSVKSKSDSNNPVVGAKYDIYSVAKIIDVLGIDKAGLPWNDVTGKLITADVVALVDGKVAPEETITSGEDGIATTTNKLVFGEYIIVPHKTPGFGVPESVYIYIPSEGGDFVLPPLDTVEFEIVSAEKKFTVSATTNFDYPAGINDIPVVKKGDEVTYTFKVVNTGSTAVDNIVINIPVPVGMTYVTSKLGDGVNGQFWLNDDIIAGIDSIEVGAAATVEVTFVVDAQVAAVYTTTATYGRFEEAPAGIPVLPETAATVSTPVLQSIGFEKSADFEDGVVSVGDEITYTFKISAPHTIYYVLLTDELPDGVTFVENSLEAKIADEEWKNISEESLHEVEDGVFALYCGTLGEVDCFVRFKVKVNNIAVNSDKEFINKADLMYEQNRIDDENVEFATITSNEVSHIVDIKVSESEIGVSKPTFIGKVGEKSDITVLKDGDEYSYSVPVKNEGTSSIKNLVIKTKIADKAEFVEADLDGKYNKETGEVVWVIPEVKPGEEIKVTVKCKVATNNEAAELVNDVFYAFANDVNNVKADEWIQLDSVIYQTIKAELSASVGGKTADEAASVKIGDKITYTGKFTILNKVYGFSFTDTLPKGITYVDGTLTFVDAEGKAVEVKVSVNEGVVTIEAIDLEAGVYTVTFDVTVDDVAEADKTFVYENKLEVSVKENKTSDEKVNVETNAIFVKTIKETPKLGAEVANKTFVWTLISIISAISSIALAAYYFIDKKRSIKA